MLLWKLNWGGVDGNGFRRGAGVASETEEAQSGGVPKKSSTVIGITPSYSANTHRSLFCAVSDMSANNAFAGRYSPCCNDAVIAKCHLHVWRPASLIPGLLEPAVLAPQGACVEAQHGMVHSGVRVFIAFAGAANHLADGLRAEVAEPCFQEMKSFDVSGPESQFVHRRKRAAFGAMSCASRIAGNERHTE